MTTKPRPSYLVKWYRASGNCQFYGDFFKDTLDTALKLGDRHGGFFLMYMVGDDNSYTLLPTWRLTNIDK